MAVEGLPVSTTPGGNALPGAVPAPAGTASTGAASAPATTPAADFMQILAGALVGGTPASSGEVTLEIEGPGPITSGDDALEDEIGFEDLSEFLANVIMPGGTPPPPSPLASTGDNETTLEVHFSVRDSGGASRPMDLATLFSSLGTDSRSAKPDPILSKDPIVGLEASLLRDASAAEPVVAAALADAGADSLSFADALDSASQSSALSPLHASSLHAVHANSQSAAPEQLKSPVGTQQWADELGTKLTWMVQQGRESASLSVTPEHLGPIEVKISVQDGQTSVWFNAANADTRSAIEQALPRLRDLFSAQGLSLADSGVFREAPRQQPAQPISGAARAGAHGDEVAVVSSVTKRGNGILDLYA